MKHLRRPTATSTETGMGENPGIITLYANITKSHTHFGSEIQETILL